ncbi:hypothetical protein PMIN03_004259 [Paraphaeosphaeria minitans]
MCYALPTYLPVAVSAIRDILYHGMGDCDVCPGAGCALIDRPRAGIFRPPWHLELASRPVPRNAMSDVDIDSATAVRTHRPQHRLHADRRVALSVPTPPCHASDFLIRFSLLRVQRG